MSTFRYNPIMDTEEKVTFVNKINYPMKYLLRKNNELMAIGYTDLRNSHGSLIDTNGCVGLFITSGCAVATINFKKRPLRRGDFILLFYDSTLSIDAASAAFSAHYASFAYPLVEEAIYKPLSDRFWDILYENPVFHLPEEKKDVLDAWWKLLKWTEGMTDKARKEEMLKNNIRNLLIAIDTEIIHALPDYEQNSGKSHAWMLVTRFFHLVALHCHQIRDVKYYATQLSITTTYLYKICQKAVRLSPKEIIDKQVITEIKTYLVNTDLSIKSIATELNFEDASYMCRYFRRITEMSPIDYRKKSSNLTHE